MINNIWPFISPFATPAENQLSDGVSPSNPNRYWDCVFACVSVGLQVYGFPDTEPEDLRQLIQPGTHAGSDFDTVASYLRAHPERWPNLPRIDTWNPPDTLAAFANILAKAYFCVFDVYDDQNANVLDHPKPGWGGTHAVVLEAMGPHNVTIWNPWNGEQAGQTFPRQYIAAATSGKFVGNLMVFARPVPGAFPAPAPIAPKPIVVTPPVVAPIPPPVIEAPKPVDPKPVPVIEPPLVDPITAARCPVTPPPVPTPPPAPTQETINWIQAFLSWIKVLFGLK